MRWKPLFAVLLGMLLLGVTAEITNAQTFGNPIAGTPSVNPLTNSTRNKEYDYYNLNNPKKDEDGKATYIWKT